MAHDLQDLLATRGTQTDAALLKALRDGLAADPALSGAAAPLHELLQRYFVLDEAATTRSFASALRRHRDTARLLLAMLAEDGEDSVVQLMGSLLDGKPRPTGALAQGLQGDAARQAARLGGGVQAGFEAFAKTALASDASSTEIELSLAWGVVEGALLDRVQHQAGVLAFTHGPAHRQQQALAAQLDAQVAQAGIGEMLAAMAAAPQPQLLARAGEWAIEHEGAPATKVPVPVRHQWHRRRPGPAAQLGDSPAAQQLKQLYAACNGAELFIPLQHQPGEPALTLIADSDWAAEREQVMTWLTLGGDESDLPDWACTLVPIAALNGDASRWVVPLQGPLAGAVLLSNDDVPEARARYASVAHFVAALRLRPHEVLANGGYVCYVVPEHEHLLYPEGYADAPVAGDPA